MNSHLCGTGNVFKVSSNLNNWGINKWRNFIKTSNKHLQNSLILLNVVFFYNHCNSLCSWKFKNEVIDWFMRCILQTIFFKNAQICLNSLTDLNKDHCIEFSVLKVNKSSKELKTILVLVESTFIFTFKMQ